MRTVRPSAVFHVEQASGAPAGVPASCAPPAPCSPPAAVPHEGETEPHVGSRALRPRLARRGQRPERVSQRASSRVQPHQHRLRRVTLLAVLRMGVRPRHERVSPTTSASDTTHGESWDFTRRTLPESSAPKVDTRPPTPTASLRPYRTPPPPDPTRAASCPPRPPPARSSTSSPDPPCPPSATRPSPYSPPTGEAQQEEDSGGSNVRGAPGGSGFVSVVPRSRYTCPARGLAPRSMRRPPRLACTSPHGSGWGPRTGGQSPRMGFPFPPDGPHASVSWGMERGAAARARGARP